MFPKFSRTIFYSVLTGVLLLVATCEKEKRAIRVFPRTLTEEVTDISTDGVHFHGRILTLGSDPVTDHGFVFNDNPLKTDLLHGAAISLGPIDAPGPFDAWVQTAMNASSEYYVCTYVKSKKYTVYGQAVSFLGAGSNGPFISGIYPTIGTWNDTIEIKGTNFSLLKPDNRVYFDTLTASVLTASDTSLKVKVPLLLQTKHAGIDINVFNKKARYKDNFSLFLPVIEKITPDNGFFNDTILITGKYFHPHTIYNHVLIDDHPLDIISSSTSEIKAIVPSGLSNGSLDLRVLIFDSLSAIKKQAFTNYNPSLSPVKGTFRDTLSFHGKNFQTGNITIRIDEIPAEPFYVSDTLIQTGIPDEVQKHYPEILLSVGSHIFVFDSAYEMLPPVIKSVFPDTIFFNDPVTLKGSYFNPVKTLNKVYIGNILSTVLFASQDSITVTVPPGIHLANGKTDLELQTGGFSTRWSGQLIIPQPVISEFSPDSGIVGEVLVINGENFNPVANYNQVRFGDTAINTFFSSPEYVKVIIPENSDLNSSVSVLTNGQASESKDFHLKKLEITDVSPINVYRGTTVTINGKNFCSNPETGKNTNKIFFSSDSYARKPVYFNHTELQFVIPNKLYAEGPSALSVQLGIQKVDLPGKLNMIEPWKKILTLNVSYPLNYICSKIGTKVYFGIGPYDRTLYELDLTNNTQKELTLYPGNKAFNAASFALGDTIYICNGGDFYAYYLKQNQWEKLNGNPYFPSGVISFVIGDRAYVVPGNDSVSFYEYNAQNRQWIRKKDLPGTTPKYFEPESFVINNTGYVIFNDGQLWTYDPDNDSWLEKKSCDLDYRYHMTAFSANGKGYAGFGMNGYDDYLSDLWEYDPVADQWTKKQFSPVGLAYCFSFSWEGKGYVGAGYQTSGYSNHILYQFDPLK